jgi:hypothetical protein
VIRPGWCRDEVLAPLQDKRSEARSRTQSLKMLSAAGLKLGPYTIRRLALVLVLPRS